MAKTNAQDPEVARRRGVRIARQPGRSPRLLHGTQVAFNVVCAACGATDTLPFVPRATDTLCAACARARYGEDWDKGRYPRPMEHEFSCISCGAVDVVPFVPDDPGAMLCRRCLRGEEAPQPGRIPSDAIDKRAGVRRRRVSR